MQRIISGFSIVQIGEREDLPSTLNNVSKRLFAGIYPNFKK